VNPQNRITGKYYAIPIYIVDLKRIAAEIVALSSLSSGDVYNVLVNFTETLPKYLKDGYKIRLGDFIFYGDKDNDYFYSATNI
jgi:hypothetical protein